MVHFKDVCRDGFGKYKFEEKSDFNYYEGHWKNDKMSGQGTLVLKNGKTRKGEWEDGNLKAPDCSIM